MINISIKIYMFIIVIIFLNHFYIRNIFEYILYKYFDILIFNYKWLCILIFYNKKIFPDNKKKYIYIIIILFIFKNICFYFDYFIILVYNQLASITYNLLLLIYNSFKLYI